MIRISQLKMKPGFTQEDVTWAAAKELRVPQGAIQRTVIRKQSIDARKKPDVRFILSVDVEVKKEQKLLQNTKDPNIFRAADVTYRLPERGGAPLLERPVIAGFGPAGMFCALLLAKCGYRPLVLERGQDVDARTRAVEQFWESGALDTGSNVQFGEGGAGTFSDGKLNTLVKDREGRAGFVLETFARAGAGGDILYVHKPHIGTDVLRTVVKNIRKEIEALGGEILFRSQVTDLNIREGRLFGITVNGREEIPCEVLVLAIGHSARDTFSMLSQKPVLMEQKPFAVGLRIEHPQSLINLAQYGAEKPEYLPPADYKLTEKLPNGRGVYSFCMCPGGYVVNASSAQGMLAVNGMSYRARDGQNANSAIVVTVSPADFGAPDVLAGVRFQERLEQAAWRLGRGRIPVQLFGDFCRKRESLRLGDILPCTKGAYELADLRECLPEVLSSSLAEGVRRFDGKIRGFARKDAVLSGVESRTSSPVRIVRGEDGVSSVNGLYPCGEGAGYAGGITSAAMDGMRIAEAVIRTYSPKIR